MTYRILFVFSVIIFFFLSVAMVVVISSGRVQVGTATCEIFNDNSGTRCGLTYCRGSQPSGSTCYDSQNDPTSLSEQSRQFCELPPSGCVVIPDERLECDLGNRSVSYARDCHGVTNTVSSRPIDCPISCTCPQPIGNKPCKKAVWNTETCSWNSTACNSGGGECEFNLKGKPATAEDYSKNLCSPCNPDPAEVTNCFASGLVYDWDSCICSQSPIVVDILGNGFNLTNLENGVSFDVIGNGTNKQIAWTSANSDDAWLALDRNGNGLIDNITELFGNNTPQPESDEKNGFLALAEFDKSANGGNADGNITQLDSVFNNLRLWQDANHNGISEVNELKTLSSQNIMKLELDYRESKKTDEHGNRFKYRAKVKDGNNAQVGRWAWDVFLVVENY